MNILEVETVQKSNKSVALLIDHNGAVLRALFLPREHPKAEIVAVEDIKCLDEQKREEAFDTLYPHGDCNKLVVSTLRLHILPLEEFTYSVTTEEPKTETKE